MEFALFLSQFSDSFPKEFFDFSPEKLSKPLTNRPVGGNEKIVGQLTAQEKLCRLSWAEASDRHQ